MKLVIFVILALSPTGQTTVHDAGHYASAEACTGVCFIAPWPPLVTD